MNRIVDFLTNDDEPTMVRTLALGESGGEMMIDVTYDYDACRVYVNGISTSNIPSVNRVLSIPDFSPYHVNSSDSATVKLRFRARPTLRHFLKAIIPSAENTTKYIYPTRYDVIPSSDGGYTKHMTMYPGIKIAEICAPVSKLVAHPLTDITSSESDETEKIKRFKWNFVYIGIATTIATVAAIFHH